MKNDLKKLLKHVQNGIVTSTTAAGSGHPTSSLSAAEVMTTLFFDGHVHYDFANPKYELNDRVIFSKGHAAPLLYSLYQAAGAISYEELLTLRQFTSRIEGHPTPRLEYIDVATGSLGQGLSVGLGMALGIKLHIKQLGSRITDLASNFREPKVWVLLGDSELAEGQVWEAMEVASHYKVNNLIGILDVNRLGQRGETMLGWDIETYKMRVEAFGWNTIVIENGNDLESVQKSLENLHAQPTTHNSQPTMIIAKTQKGAGVSSIADKDGWHGKALPKEMLDEALKEIGTVDTTKTGTVLKPIHIELTTHNLQPTTYNLQPKMATREAYGEALKHIATDSRVVVLDAETSNSTFAEKMKEVAPERFFEMYIAEQNMMSVALGFSKVGFIPYVSSFAAFFARAYDQIRMGQYSDANVKIVGSHAGVSIGADGSSQMALEDIAMMRALLESVVIYPSDAVSTVKLVEEMKKHTGTSYLRITREKTATLYPETEEFPIGGSKILKSSRDDIAVVVAGGFTVHEALKAYEKLVAEGIHIAIIDLYSIKPIDAKTLSQYAKRTGHVVVVEDHYPDGGIGDAVHRALDGLTVKFTHLAVREIPRSGTPDELLHFEKIDAAAIVNAVKK